MLQVARADADMGEAFAAAGAVRGLKGEKPKKPKKDKKAGAYPRSLFSST